MSKAELVAVMAQEAGISKVQAEKALKAFTSAVTDELKKGEKVQLVGFGTFESTIRAAKDGINPLTKERAHYEAKRVPKFKAGKTLKDAVANA